MNGRYLLVGAGFWLFAFAVDVLAGGLPTGKGPCKGQEQCQENVCVEINGESYCSKNCGECPPGMYCDADLFKFLELKLCLKGRAEKPAKPTSPPRLPCRTDEDCKGTLVCAQMMGARDCTRECEADRDCEMPMLMGVKFDFFECALDEGKRGRKACLPKESCLKNPMACTKIDTAVMGQVFSDMSAMASKMENAVVSSQQGGEAATAQPSYPSPAPKIEKKPPWRKAAFPGF